MDQGMKHDTLTDMSPAASEEAFEALFLAQYAGVVRTVRRLVRDPRVAEEITQDSFVRLLQHWSKVSRYDRPDLWVRRVAIRQAQRERHRDWQRPVVELRSAVSPGTVEDHPADDAVLDAVRGLPPKQRAIVVLFYYEDRPMNEIADIVGCAVSTGWSQLHTARKRLAAVLGEEVSDDVR